MGAGWCLALCLFLLSALAAADVGEGHFEIRSVYTEYRDGVFYLNGRVSFRLSDPAREALHSGVPLRLELDIKLNRKRRWWLDSEAASLRQVAQLQFHALTQRYLVRNFNSGEQFSFFTLADALDEIGHINQLPLIDEALLEPDQPYEVSMQAVLELRDLPGAIRWMTFWWGDLRTESDWYRWPLKP
jgi:hypothetical protein